MTVLFIFSVIIPTRTIPPPDVHSAPLYYDNRDSENISVNIPRPPPPFVNNFDNQRLTSERKTFPIAPSPVPYGESRSFSPFVPYGPSPRHYALLPQSSSVLSSSSVSSDFQPNTIITSRSEVPMSPKTTVVPAQPASPLCSTLTSASSVCYAKLNSDDKEVCKVEQKDKKLSGSDTLPSQNVTEGRNREDAQVSPASINKLTTPQTNEGVHAKCSQSLSDVPSAQNSDSSKYADDDIIILEDIPSSRHQPYLNTQQTPGLDNISSCESNQPSINSGPNLTNIVEAAEIMREASVRPEDTVIEHSTSSDDSQPSQKLSELPNSIAPSEKSDLDVTSMSVESGNRSKGRTDDSSVSTAFVSTTRNKTKQVVSLFMLGMPGSLLQQFGSRMAKKNAKSEGK